MSISNIKVTVIGRTNKKNTINYRNFEVTDKKELSNKTKQFQKQLSKKYGSNWNISQMNFEYNGVVHLDIRQVPLKTIVNKPKFVSQEEAWKIAKEKIKKGEIDFFVRTWVHSLSNVLGEKKLTQMQMKILNKDLYGIERDYRVDYSATYNVFSHIEPNYFLLPQGLTPYIKRVIEKGAKRAPFGVYMEPKEYLKTLISMEGISKRYFENYETFKKYLIKYTGISKQELKSFKKNEKEVLKVKLKDGIYHISFKFNRKTAMELNFLAIRNYNKETRTYITDSKYYVSTILETKYFKENYNLKQVENVLKK